MPVTPTRGPPGDQPKVALTAYAAAHVPKAGINCWLCNIPERSEVEAAFANGVRKSVILNWLREECGYGEQNAAGYATASKVSNHLRDHLNP